MSDTIIDPHAIDTLRSLGDGDDAFLREIVDIYLLDTPERLAELRAHLAAGNHPALARAAHTIKGSSGNVGADQVRNLAETLETLSAQTPPPAGLALRVEQLEQAFAHARIALGQILGDSP